MEGSAMKSMIASLNFGDIVFLLSMIHMKCHFIPTLGYSQHCIESVTMLYNNRYSPTVNIHYVDQGEM